MYHFLATPPNFWTTFTRCTTKKTSDSPITRVSLISFDRLCIAPQFT